MSRPTRHLACGLVVAGLLTVAACGGDDRAGTSTTVAAPTSPAPETTAVPETTAAPETTAPVTSSEPATTTSTSTSTPTAPAGGTLSVRGGFLTLDVPDGWVAAPTDPMEARVDFPDAAWQAGDLEDLVVIDASTLQMKIGFERGFGTAPAFADWLEASAGSLVGALVPEATEPVSWAGGEGELWVGTASEDAAWGLYTAGVGRHRLYASLLVTPEARNGDLDLAEQMLTDLRVDPAALDPFTHAFDARRNVSASVTGGSEFTVSVLVPAWWSFSESDAGGLFEDPDSEGFVNISVTRSDRDLDGEVEREVAEFADEEFFLGVPTTREDRVVRSVPTVILWEGDPATTDAAAVFGSDGVIFSRVYVYTPGDHDLLVAIVDSLVYPDSALAP